MNRDEAIKISPEYKVDHMASLHPGIKSLIATGQEESNEFKRQSQLYHQVSLLFNTFKLFWLILGQRKTSLVIFFIKKGERVQLSFWPILFLMA